MVATETAGAIDRSQRLEARKLAQESRESTAWLLEWQARRSPFDPVDEPPRALPLDGPLLGCIRPDCPSPCGPGDQLLCVEHRGAASLPAVGGGES
jgi:hypothetical protein